MRLHSVSRSRVLRQGERESDQTPLELVVLLNGVVANDNDAPDGVAVLSRLQA